MLRVIHNIASWVLKRRLEQVQYFMDHPLEVQARLFGELIAECRKTAWGKAHGYDSIKDVDTFRERVPISPYEALFPWIDRAFRGEADVLWPGRVRWFSKSSGTTNDKSKFIPVTEASLEFCHYKAGQDLLAIYLHNRPDSQLFTGKALSMGGSHTPHPQSPGVNFGDVSAVLTENLPIFYELVRTPSKDVALLPDWETKLAAMVREVMFEDVTSMAGVPTWTLVLLHRLLEGTGLGHIGEVWPNLELYLHGGVNFDPYRAQFQELIPLPGMTYMDCYNASEGFFSVQNDPSQPDMLLLLDYGIFYEFIPLEALDQEHPPTHTLAEVETGRNYAMLISTNAGLWRYLIGDTVMFTSLRPYKIRVTGRTKHFINAFGEELMVENAEMAMAEACRRTEATVTNFTAAPIFFAGKTRGGHEWLIEFGRPPEQVATFTAILDETLKALNSDYEAKRQGDLALGPPKVHVLPTGTFHAWMKRRGKLGGQHKVPRLANHREYLEDLLHMVAVSS